MTKKIEGEMVGGQGGVEDATQAKVDVGAMALQCIGTVSGCLKK